MKKLVHWSTKDGEDCAPFVLCFDPVLRKDLLSHEKSSFPSFASKNERLQVDHTVTEHLRRKRLFLENSGALCVVMPCHVSHSWHDEVSRGCSVPFLHMGECVARELKEAKLRPLEAGSPLRIGVLATDATLAAGFYQKKLQNEVHIDRNICFLCPFLFILFFITKNIVECYEKQETRVFLKSPSS